MTNPRILLTGATGRTGSAVVTQLLAKGWPVRAAVRVRDARSDLLQSRGPEVVVADIFDPGQLTDAMRGVQRAYFCPPYHPFVIQSAVAFADAARETRLEQIVGLSQWLAGPNHPSLMTRQLWLIDRMFAALPGIAHTVVNPGFFADSPYLEMTPFAAHLGVFPLPVAGESRDAPPSVDDILDSLPAGSVDSSQLAFEVAAKAAFRQTMPKAGPELLEPIMKVDVFVPDQNVGDVIGDLNRRRGIISGQEPTPTNVRIRAEVPLSEMFGYIGDLRSNTQGRGQFAMEFARYAGVPKNILEKVKEQVKEREAAKK